MVVVSCQPKQSINSTVTQSPTKTASPTTAQTNTPTSTQTTTPTPTLLSAILTPISNNSQIIDVSNVNKLAQIAAWGDGQLYSIRISSDGKKIVAVLSTGVWVFDAQSLEIISHLEKSIPDEFVVGWAVSPNGEKFIILDENANLTIWQLTNNKLLGSMELNRDQDIGCASEPENFVFSADNNTLGIFGDCNGYTPFSRILLIRTSNQQTLLKLEGKEFGLFSPDGKLLVTYGMGGYDKDYSVKLWNTSDGSLLQEFNSEKPVNCSRTYLDMGKSPWNIYRLGNEHTCVSFSPDSKKLAIGFKEATRLYSTSDGSELGSFSNGRPWFSNDSQMLFLYTTYPHSIGYDLSNNTQLNFSTELYYPLPSPDGRYITAVWTVKKEGSSYTIGGLILRDLKLGNDIARFAGYSGSVFSTDGNCVALSSGVDKSKPILLIETTSGKIIQMLNGETSPKFLPGSKSLMTEKGNELIVRDLHDSTIIYTLKNFAWPQIHPDGQSIIALEGNNIYRIDISNGKILAKQLFPISPENLFYTGTNIIETSLTGNRILALPKLTYQTELGPAGLISPDSLHYAISFTDGIEIWSMNDTSNPLYFIPTGGQNLIIYSTDGELLAIDKVNGEIEVRNVYTGDLLKTLNKGISKTVEQMVILPDHSRLYIIAKQGNYYSLMGWRLTDGSILPTQNVTYNSPIGISADSKLLAYVSGPGQNELSWQISIVQIQGWLIISSFEEKTLGGNFEFSFSPNNEIIAITSPPGGIRLWDVENATLLRTIIDNQLDNKLFLNRIANGGGFISKGQFGVSVSFSTDGKYLLRTADGIATIWGIP
jgi:hypothetical protein